MIVDGVKDLQGDGEWGNILSWPIIPLHSIVLPDGNVLSFGTDERGMQGGQYVYDLWDPETNVHRTLPNTTKANIFCSNMSLDPTTGNVIIMGGDNNGTPGLGALSGRQDVLIFDYTKQEIRDAKPGDDSFDLTDGRYYGTTITLPNGEVMMIGGRDKDYVAATTPEIYNPEIGVRQLTGADMPSLAANPGGTTLTSTDGNHWYPHAFVNSRGDVIVIEADGEDVYRMTTDGAGSVEKVGTLPFTSYTLNSSIMFDQDKIMLLGDDGGLWVGDLSTDTPTWTREAQIESARTDAGLVILPNGHVAIIGGGSPIDQGNVLADAVYNVTVWNPETNSITQLEDQALARLYHSSALMLPDGSIFSGGGGAPGPLVNLNAEIYLPNYLFDADGNLADRPEITQAPSNIESGDVFQITVDDSSTIDMISITRSGAMTHARNSDARFLELEFTVIDANTIEISTPSNINVIGPGVWMLTAVDSAGVPSVSSMLGVDMAPLVETPDLVATSPIYNIDDEQINGAFEVSVEARFDDIDGGNWQRIFDFGNGARQDNIFLGQAFNSDDMKFEIWRDGRAYSITAPDAIVEGEIASWRVSVDPNGWMQLFKNDALLVQGQGIVPADVERSNLFVGASNWSADSYLRGMVRNLEVTNLDNLKVGTNGADTLQGTDGDDILDGRGGNDNHYGGKGDDILRANTGSNLFDGGEGTDTFDIAGSGTPSTAYNIDLASGGDTFGNRYVSIENVLGGSSNDRIAGTTGDNILTGGLGNDTLEGRGGNDTLNGNEGKDTVVLAGKLSDYTIAMRHETGMIIELTGPDGVTTVRNVELFTFTGEQVTYSLMNLMGQAGTNPKFSIDDIDGAFTAEATARFDDLDGGRWQRIFDFGNGQAQDNILLGQISSTNGMTLRVWRDGKEYVLDAPNAIIEGETATWRVSIDDLGMMRLYKNNVLLVEGQGVVPADIDRSQELVGLSNWGWDSSLIGEVSTLTVVDGVIDGPLSPIISGTDAADILVGTDRDDEINANGGDDSITISSGNDSIDGGTGTDTLVVPGSATDYTVELDTDGNVVIISSDGGRTSLQNIEFVTVQGDNITYSIADVIAYANETNEPPVSSVPTDVDDVIERPTDGNYVIDGLAGNDTLSVGGTADDYVLSFDGGDHDLVITGPEGNSVALINVENILVNGETFTIEDAIAYAQDLGAIDNGSGANAGFTLYGDEVV